MKFLSALLLCWLLALQSAQGATVELKINGHSIHSEIANTPESRSHGLMERDHLCADCGMLFVFIEAGPYGFWMKDTPLPLSIAFISADGSILNLDEMEPNTTSVHRAGGDALYVLEMNSKWFARNHIRQGDKVQGLEHTHKGQ